MAENGRNHPDRHRHSRPPALKHRRRRVLLIIFAALVACAVTAVLVLTLQDRSSKTVAETPVARTSTIPSSLPTTTPAPVITATATTSEVPRTFTEAIGQIGIPLDPHTGWVIAQGICVRLGQPGYDRFRLAEGIERLFPSVSDEQAHAFVDMVATAVCPM